MRIPPSASFLIASALCLVLNAKGQLPPDCVTQNNTAATGAIRERLARWVTQTNQGDRAAAGTIWAAQVTGWVPQVCRSGDQYLCSEYRRGCSRGGACRRARHLEGNPPLSGCRRHGDARNPRVRVVALPAGRVLANTAVGQRARALDPVPVVWQRLRPNKRLKLAARVDEGMNLSSARRSLSAIR